jgi:polyribonucleotide nucleotidyltransferase
MLQERLRQQIGETKRAVPSAIDASLEQAVVRLAQAKIAGINQIKNKAQRGKAAKALFEEVYKEIEQQYPESEVRVKSTLDKLRKEHMREQVLASANGRIDGRGLKDIRSIDCEVGILPRVHGSALFTRGQTQSLCAITLGTTTDQQRVEDLEGESFKTFMLHYNFPPFSVGEVRPMRGPGRREIGHGALAEKALETVLPIEERFPYTIRIVSDILESNGSSSMATVCGSSLALMDAGVPIKSAVAGISIGLVKEGERYALLSDIVGEEDHYGDMDFKIAGTREGITAIQLDTKISGLSMKIIEEALSQAKEGRNHILDIMDSTLKEPRTTLSDYAPKVIMLTVPKEKIGEIIGPGGKVIRRLIEETGAKIEISDDGKVSIISSSIESVENAEAKIKALVEDVEVGNIVVGKVTRIANFGAFVEITPGKEGLIHISQLAHHRVAKVEDEVKVGDEVTAMVKEIDDLGRINLSRKAVMPKPNQGKRFNQKGSKRDGQFQKKPPGKRNNSSNRKH